MRNKTILITGAAGSIGSELCRQLADNNNVIAIDQNESGLFDLKGVIPEIADIRDFDRIQEIFKLYNPQLVFHTAAYKHLSRYEKDHFSEIIKTNILGTMNVLRCRPKKFIFISTDKAVDPTSLMGATKLIGEIISKRCGGIVVRFGNVIGSRGSVMPIWEKQIAMGKPATITNPEMERYFMSIKDACDLVIKAATIGKGGEIIILDMGQPRKIIEVLIEKFGDVPIKIIGAKQGEKITEELMTLEEKSKAIKRGKFWIIK